MYKSGGMNPDDGDHRSKINNNIPSNVKIIDFRSDTITKPDAEMRRVMAEAEVGDDVFGEDPSVIALQQQTAELLGKEASLFVPTGTMANQIAVMSHCWTRGAEIIVGDKSHIFLYEQGGAATLGGVHTHAIKNLTDGTFSLDNLQSAVRSDDIHNPITSLVCIENTHNIMGGKVLPLAWLDELGRITKKLGLPVHLDGARLLNAAVALKVPPARLTRDCSSVSLCLSKGLGAPVGSLICGSKDFIQRALRLRKVLGGGMRQSGILAAAGSLALARYQATLSMDNENAKIIAKRVRESASKKVSVDVEGVHSNIVMLDCLTEELGPAALQEKLEQVDLPHDAVSVRSLAINDSQVRIVTNNSVDTEAIVLACEKIIKVIT